MVPVAGKPGLPVVELPVGVDSGSTLTGGVAPAVFWLALLPQASKASGSSTVTTRRVEGFAMDRVFK